MLLTQNDPTKLELAVFDKDGKQIAVSEMGKADVSVTGLPDGETVADGTYKLAYTDGTNVGPKVDAPGIVITKAGTDTGSNTGTGTDNGSGTSTTGSGSTPASNAAGSGTVGKALAG